MKVLHLSILQKYFFSEITWCSIPIKSQLVDSKIVVFENIDQKEAKRVSCQWEKGEIFP